MNTSLIEMDNQENTVKSIKSFIGWTMKVEMKMKKKKKRKNT